MLYSKTTFSLGWTESTCRDKVEDHEEKLMDLGENVALCVIRLIVSKYSWIHSFLISCKMLCPTYAHQSTHNYSTCVTDHDLIKLGLPVYCLYLPTKMLAHFTRCPSLEIPLSVDISKCICMGSYKNYKYKCTFRSLIRILGNWYINEQRILQSPNLNIGKYIMINPYSIHEWSYTLLSSYYSLSLEICGVCQCKEHYTLLG